MGLEIGVWGQQPTEIAHKGCRSMHSSTIGVYGQTKGECAGIRLDEASPDSTTIGRFRNALVKADVYDSILSGINRQLEDAGVIVKNGAIVDASVTDSPRRPRGRKQYVVAKGQVRGGMCRGVGARVP